MNEDFLVQIRTITDTLIEIKEALWYTGYALGCLVGTVVAMTISICYRLDRLKIVESRPTWNKTEHHYHNRVDDGDESYGN